LLLTTALPPYEQAGHQSIKRNLHVNPIHLSPVHFHNQLIRTTKTVSFINATSRAKTHQGVWPVGSSIPQSAIFRGQTRSPFDHNIIYQFDAMESILDYTFQHLSITTESVDHPVVMTEAPCHPLWSKKGNGRVLVVFEGFSDDGDVV